MNLFSIEPITNDPDGYDFTVHFSHDKDAYKYFDQYTKAVGNIKDKKFDSKGQRWKIRTQDVIALRSITVETKKDKQQPLSFLAAGKKTVTNTQDVGSWMKLQPYQYQKDVIKFCTERESSLIVGSCGMGKTAILIAIYGELLRAEKIQGPGLIVVKASIKAQWQAEIKKFSDYEPRVIRSFSDLKKDQKAFDAQFTGADLYITNYDALRDDKIRSAIHKIGIEYIACDECQAFKSPTAKRAKAVHEFSTIKYRIAATATPIQNNPVDIFSIFKFLDPTLFPKRGDFERRYVRFNQWFRPCGSLNEKELNFKISPYMIVKTKQEISSQLPKLVVSQRYCSFTTKQQDVYARMMTSLDSLHEEEKNARAKLQKAGAKTSDGLKQIEAKIMMFQTFAQELSDDERLLSMSESDNAKEFITGDKSAKTDMLLDLVHEILDSGEKVAIFSRFARYQDILMEEFSSDKDLKKVKIARVTGALNDKKRYEEVQTKFTKDPNYKILLASDAMAEGVSLSECGYIIEVDLAQSYALQTQRHGRIERADSTHRTVFVYQLLTENSYDTEIAQRIIEKKEGFDATIIKGE